MHLEREEDATEWAVRGRDRWAEAWFMSVYVRIRVSAFTLELELGIGC